MQLVNNIIISKENDGDELRENLRKCANSLKADGTLAILQLTHVSFYELEIISFRLVHSLRKF